MKRYEVEVGGIKLTAEVPEGIEGDVHLDVGVFPEDEADVARAVGAAGGIGSFNPITAGYNSLRLTRRLDDEGGSKFELVVYSPRNEDGGKPELAPWLAGLAERQKAERVEAPA